MPISPLVLGAALGQASRQATLASGVTEYTRSGVQGNEVSEEALYANWRQGQVWFTAKSLLSA